jgi:DNA polymerase I-like protein with 3'-5' exonuclease and polymerase domains
MPGGEPRLSDDRRRLSSVPGHGVVPRHAHTFPYGFNLKTRLIAFDTETTGLIPYGPPSYWGYNPARPFAFSLCDSDGNTDYIRWAVDPRTRKPIINPTDWAALCALFADPSIVWVGHNIAFDLRMILEMGVRVAGEVHDTQILAHVATAGDELSYALKPLSKKWAKYPDDDEKKLEQQVTLARKQAKANGWLIAGGKKEVDRGDFVVFAGSKPVKADYWLVPGPDYTCSLGQHRAAGYHKNLERADLVQQYAVGDVLRCMLLFLLWYPEVGSDERLGRTYIREMQLFHVLRKMERRGTRVYPAHTEKLVKWYRRYMKRMEQMAIDNGGLVPKKLTKAQERRGEQPQMELMNFNSNKQLAQKFYVERGYDPTFTETFNEKEGRFNYKIGKDQLAMWGGVDDDGEYKDPLAKAILEYRAAKQSITAFLNIYAKFWYPESGVTAFKKTRQFKKAENAFIARLKADLATAVDDGEITLADREEIVAHYTRQWASGVWVLHPNYNQTGAVTGRMTCSDPNLQQVASATTGLRKADIPSRPRECFGPRPKCLWYLPDYSQVEVWAFAFLSGEPKMQEQLLAGHDFHSAVSKISFGAKADYAERAKYYRKLAKLIMFGKLYGGGVGTPDKPGRMTKLLQMPFDEAKAFIDSWEKDFAEAKAFMKSMSREAERNGEAWNVFGRRYKLEREWAYKVVNYLIQGACADLLKVATARLDWMLTERYDHPLLGLLNTIHDELMIEVPYDLHSNRLMREIMWVMQMDSPLFGMPVPLPVGMKIATKRWSHTKGIAIPGFTWENDNHEHVMGGRAYDPKQRRAFAELEEFMQDCPHGRVTDLDTAFPLTAPLMKAA